MDASNRVSMDTSNSDIKRQYISACRESKVNIRINNKSSYLLSNNQKGKDKQNTQSLCSTDSAPSRQQIPRIIVTDPLNRQIENIQNDTITLQQRTAEPTTNTPPHTGGLHSRTNISRTEDRELLQKVQKMKYEKRELLVQTKNKFSEEDYAGLKMRFRVEASSDRSLLLEMEDLKETLIKQEEDLLRVTMKEKFLRIRMRSTVPS
eukprot:TRINITY_DN2002_c0_g1_i1.p1 TRINITY_DN2002_c0_g1~~TRINITY_DN2002_c0_g1_i1.p1  ORF type:complete len:242 (-),score=71.98 TRINITY_DN2002_c0_g1_i1:155-772(-)